MNYQEKAKQIVIDYYNEHVEVTDNKKLKESEVFIVWFSKTLQNWKALISTTISDGMYYEVTYNGDKKETYLDAYKKWENVCVKDEELVKVSEVEQNETVKMRGSADYKERFKAEYCQTKIRYDKLHQMLIKYEAGTLDFTPTCDIEILERQARYMGNYLKCLEIRAEIEKIKLEV